MPSYSPEAVQRGLRPSFNTSAASLYANGVNGIPVGLRGNDLTSTILLALADGPAASVAITAAGTGLTNGTPTGVATTALTGTGSGMTVNLTVAGGIVTVAARNAAGTGYSTGDTVSVTGYAGVVLTVTI
jgi:hypothetical protein